MKNTTELIGNWNVLKGKLIQKYAILTDNDILFKKGKKNELTGKLHVNLSKTKGLIPKLVADL